MDEWMMFPRLCICSGVTLKYILYLLNCKTCLRSNLYCTGQQVETKVINTSVVLWRRGNKKERPVQIFSTIISSQLSLAISALNMNKESVSMWQTKVGRTLKCSGILATLCVHLWKFRASARCSCGAAVATRGQRLNPGTISGRKCSWKSVVVLDHCIRRIAGHWGCNLEQALQLQSSNHISSIRLSERHERRMGIIISVLWSWVTNINACFTCNPFGRSLYFW